IFRSIYHIFGRIILALGWIITSSDELFPLLVELSHLRTNYPRSWSNYLIFGRIIPALGRIITSSDELFPL
ncbi:hypothetical protein, partial [Peribacillus muralis]|uniref:hypothetical protein n=1 Tax=Peribacillus muralis TaxID=264697 RepID=UPI001F16974C